MVVLVVHEAAFSISLDQGMMLETGKEGIFVISGVFHE
jgi:pyridoxal biosynthesis lyase PdxS